MWRQGDFTDNSNQIYSQWFFSISWCTVHRVASIPRQTSTYLMTLFHQKTLKSASSRLMWRNPPYKKLTLWFPTLKWGLTHDLFQGVWWKGNYILIENCSRVFCKLGHSSFWVNITLQIVHILTLKCKNIETPMLNEDWMVINESIKMNEQKSTKTYMLKWKKKHQFN